MNDKNTGVKRLFYACYYSWLGLVAALRYEAAFRQEFIVFILLVIGSFFLDVTSVERVILLASVAFVLIMELINSAVECAIDRIGTKHHVLSGRAKDYGSLAVLISVLIAAAIWGVILF